MKKQRKVITPLFVLGALCVQGCAGYMFGNKGYASEIAIDSGYVTSENIVELLKEGVRLGDVRIDAGSPELENRRTTEEGLYLVINLRNNGRSTAWGMLEYRMGRNFDKKYKLSVPGLKPDRDHLFIVPLHGKILTEAMLGEAPPVEWENLYTKP